MLKQNMQRVLSLLFCTIFILCLLPLGISTQSKASPVQNTTAQDHVNIQQSRKPALPSEGTYIPNRLLVKIQDTENQVTAMSLPEHILGARKLFSVPSPSAAVQSHTALEAGAAPDAAWYLLQTKEAANLEQIMDDLLLDPNVLAVEFDRKITADMPIPIEVQDPLGASQSYLDFMHVPQAYAAFGDKIPGDGIVVAVLDSGIDQNHPDLKDRIASGGKRIYDDWEFLYYTNEYEVMQLVPAMDDNYEDVLGHGTHVSGIIAGAKNQIGITGIAYGAKILPVKVIDDVGNGSVSNILLGIDYAVSAGAHIINMSLRVYEDNFAWLDACSAARDAGVLVVSAAGNEALPTSAYDNNFYMNSSVPANVPDVFSVMALTETPDQNGDYLSYFSNWDSDPYAGVEYPIAAPGTDIISTYIGGKYCKMSGTSMATPAVSGAAAVLMSAGFSASETWTQLVSSANELQGKTMENGEILSVKSINLYGALQPLAAKPVVKTSYSIINPAEFVVDPENKKSIYLPFMGDQNILAYKNETNALLAVEITAYDAGIKNLKIAGESIHLLDAPDEIAVGRTRTIYFSIADLKQQQFNTSISIQYTDENGNAQPALSIPVSVPVLQIAIPNGLRWDPAGYYTPVAKSVEIVLDDTSTVWVLPASLRLFQGQSLILQPGTMMVLEDESSIIAAKGTLDVNGSQANRVMLLGGFDSKIESQNGTVRFHHADILNLSISQANEINASAISFPFSSPFPYEDGNAFEISAHRIENSNLDRIHYSKIKADQFIGNLVQNCIGSELNANTVQNCTLIENLSVFPLMEMSVSNNPLRVITNHYGNGKGFFDNCVIGPIKVYSEYNTKGVRPTAKLATINNVYYQPVEAKIMGILPTLSDVDDKIYCAGNSKGISSNPSEKQELFAACPPFILSQEKTAATYIANKMRGELTVKLQFSRPVNPSGVHVIPESLLGNPLYYGLNHLFSSEMQWAADATACDITLFESALSLGLQDYFTFQGFSMIDQPHMTLSGQTFYNNPIGLDTLFLTNETLQIEDSIDGPTLYWSDAVGLEDAYVITRTDTAGQEVQLYSAAAQNIPMSLENGCYRFTDTTFVEDIRYTYTVTGYSTDANHITSPVSSGSAVFLRPSTMPKLAFSADHLDMKINEVNTLLLIAENSMAVDHLQFDIYTKGNIDILDVLPGIFAADNIPFSVSALGKDKVRITVGEGLQKIYIGKGDTIIQFSLQCQKLLKEGNMKIQGVWAKDGDTILTVENEAVCKITAS